MWEGAGTLSPTTSPPTIPVALSASPRREAFLVSSVTQTTPSSSSKESINRLQGPDVCDRRHMTCLVSVDCSIHRKADVQFCHLLWLHCKATDINASCTIFVQCILSQNALHFYIVLKLPTFMYLCREFETC